MDYTNQLTKMYEEMKNKVSETIFFQSNSNFIFYDEFNYNPNNYTKINISVLGKETDNCYYYIQFDYEHYIDNKLFFPDDDVIPSTHPFKYCYEKDMSFEGSIVVKNELTEKLIKYLLMSFDDLKKFSGNNSSQTYKSMIMKTVVMLYN